MSATSTSDPPASEAILLEVANGDRRRFDAFVDAHKVAMISYLVRRVGDRHRAEDLTHEVLKGHTRLFRVEATTRASFCNVLCNIAALHPRFQSNFQIVDRSRRIALRENALPEIPSTEGSL